ncbi:hypothetical protein [Catonella sp.]|uniref:hypothetical protein n=1 Tax=Catonella sp. TaxID=2382125 RepID=UPI003FA11184
MPDFWLSKSMKKRSIRFLVFLVLFFAMVILIDKTVHAKAASPKEMVLKVNSFLVEQDEVQDGATCGAIVTVKLGITGVDKNAKLNHAIYYSPAKTDVDWAEVKLKSTGAEVVEKIIVRVPNSGYYYFKIISKKGKKTVEKIIDFPVYVSGDRYLAGIEFMRDRGKQPLVEGILGRYVDDKAEITWNGTENGRYLVRLYNGYTMETISEKYTDETRYITDVPKEIENVAYFVAHINQNGNNGDFILYNMPERNSPNAIVRFPARNTVNDEEISIDVLFTGECKVDIIVNDTVEADGSEASGTYNIILPEGDVKIIVSITDEAGNVKNYIKELKVDATKPKVVLDKVIDGAVTTDNTIDITGECSEDVTLIMNGQKKEVKKGSFSFTQNLSIGENDIKIQAIDSAGNKSNVRAVITRETEHKRSMKATMLVGTTFGIIFLAYIVTFSGWIVKKRKN